MADVRKIKVLSVEFNREYTPQGKPFTVYYFNIKTEDGISGEFSTSSRDQKKFLVGQEYEVKIEVKTTGKGSYNFFDYSDAEKEKKKKDYTGGFKKGGNYKYVRSREEVLLIITQSSYEAATVAAAKISKYKILNPPFDSNIQLTTICKAFSEYVVNSCGLNSPECKSDNKDALKKANDKSIVYQKAIKIAIEALDIETMKPSLESTADALRTTRGLITLTDLIVKDIFTIANGL